MDALDLLIYGPSALLVVGGAAMLAGGIVRWQKRKKLLRYSVKTEGKVLNLIAERRRKAVRYFVEIGYKTQEGKEYHFRTDLSTDQPHFNEGESVLLLYDSRNPHRALVAEYWHIWFWPIFLVSIGFIMLALGVWMLWGTWDAIGNLPTRQP